MRILVLNAGSSSLKFRLFEANPSPTPGPQPSVPSPDSPPNPQPSAFSTILSGSITGIGGETKMHMTMGEDDWTPSQSIHNHAEAVRWLLDRIEIRSVEAVGHRVVHGGERFHAPTVLTETVIEEIDRLSMLAPLHNLSGVAVIRAVRAVLGTNVPMVAVFDTAFHAHMPAVAATYAIPRDLAARHHIRRYGFHGIAHASLAQGAARALDCPLHGLRLITLQLGNGCSAAAVDRGRSIDTSMGLTPLEGLVMGTRSGDLDPAIVPYVIRREAVSGETVERWLNEQSGLLGLSGLSNDVRELLTAEERGDRNARDALDIFCYRVRKYIGAYLSVLGGADAVVFGGGIGEHAPRIRERICTGMDWCGLVLDRARNQDATRLRPGEAIRIDSERGTLAAVVVGVDEETAIALETATCLVPGPGP